VLVVLLAHVGAWQAMGNWQPLASTPPPRLAVQLTRAMQADTSAPPRRSAPPVAPTAAAAPTAPASAVAEPVDPATAATPEAAPALASLSPPPLAQTASSPAVAPRDGDDTPSPEWPLSTQLRYAVVGHYQGPVHGDAEVEWLRQGRRYQVRLRVGIGPRLAPFGQRRLVSEGRLTPAGIAPQRYDEETQMLWRAGRRSTVRIAGGEATLADGRTVVAPAGTQDSASQFVHLTWLLLTGREPARAGHVIPLPLALPMGVGTWRYEVVGEVELDTPLGRIAAWHLRPQPPYPPGTLAAQVWLAPGYQYLPVQIRIEQGEGVWMTLTLAEPPLQEAPAPDNSNPSKENPR